MFWVWTSVVIGVVLIVGWVIWSYNRFVEDKNYLIEAERGIDVQLKRRRNLVPPLVDVVKEYSEHEQTLLESVTKARKKTDGASTLSGQAEVESILSVQVQNVLGLAEDYPELKADNSFQKLQDTLVEIEDEIQYARRYYNGTVRNFNIRCNSFPNNIVAKLFGFTPKDYFVIRLTTEEDPPEVNMKS
ncbi:MAG: LemA family protein [bacterium]